MNKFIIAIVLYLLAGCAFNNDTDEKVDEKNYSSGKRLNSDELRGLRQRLSPLVYSANSSYADRKYSVLLPERLERFGPDFISVRELMKLELSGKLPNEVSEYLYQTVVEYRAGYFSLDEIHRSWILFRPDWVRLWWHHARINGDFDSILGFGSVDISPDQFVLDGASYNNVFIPNSNNFNNSELKIPPYFRAKEKIIGNEGLLTPAQYLPILRSKPHWLEDNIKGMDEIVVFKAPILLRKDEHFCRTKIQGNKSERDIIFNEFSKKNNLSESQYNEIISKCFDVGYMAAYRQKTAGDYYLTLLDKDPQEFVNGELFQYKQEDSRPPISDYYRQILMDSLSKLKSSLKSEFHDEVDKATVVITPEGESDKPNYLFHAYTAVGSGKIRISPVMVLAAAAQCRLIQVKAVQVTNGITSYLKKQQLLYSGNRGFNNEVYPFYEQPQNTEPLLSFSTIENKPSDMDENNFIYNEIDWREKFESCVGGNLSLLLAHELAHVYMVESTEEKRYCAALSHLQRETQIDTFRGKTFLESVMLNAVISGRNELWNWGDEDSKGIRQLFDNMNGEYCSTL